MRRVVAALQPWLVFTNARAATSLRQHKVNVTKNEVDSTKQEALEFAQEDGDFYSIIACTPSDRDAGGGWGAVSQPQSGMENTCVNGKLAPEVYLLGAATSLTTSLAFELTGAGATCAGGATEFGFWTEETVAAFKQEPDQVLASWLSAMPDCDEGSRQLVGDFTPAYLALVPQPASAHELPWTAGLPFTLSQAYGMKSRSLNFVVALQEPLQRMSSVMRRLDISTGSGEEAPIDLDTFRNDAWASMYGWQLRVWTQVFHPDQFYIIPFAAFAGATSEAICRDLSTRMSFAIDCKQMLMSFDTSLQRTLAAEMSEEFRAMFTQYMQRDKDVLLDTLVDGTLSGMGLAAYRGARGNCTQIQEWLERYW